MSSISTGVPHISIVIALSGSPKAHAQAVFPVVRPQILRQVARRIVRHDPVEAALQFHVAHRSEAAHDVFRRGKVRILLHVGIGQGAARAGAPCCGESDAGQKRERYGEPDTWHGVRGAGVQRNQNDFLQYESREPKHD